MKLATFDIFDTTLIRKCGLPNTVFHILALKLWPDRKDYRDEFVRWRIQAAKNGHSLKDIYASPSSDCFVGYTPEELMEMEMQVESEQLIVNASVKDLIDKMRSNGWTIKFLSDMYLPSDLLFNILLREGCIKSEEEVIVSCEWNAHKEDGTLYKKVSEKYKPTSWTHHGDNYRSDIKKATQNGVVAVKVDTGYSEIEKLLIRESRDHLKGWQLSMLASFSRAFRLNSNNSATEIIAADFVSPLYIPFVIDIFRQSQKLKIEKLHFLSRDGYIMKCIMEVLSCDKIDINYLFVSRRSLMRAYLANNSEHRYLMIADRKSLLSRSVDHLLWQLQLTRDELKSKFGIIFQYNKILTPAQERDFLDKLFHHPVFTPWLTNMFNQDLSLTRRYLTQEGLTAQINQAMVDIGWLGTTRMMINELIQEQKNDISIPTFYVGVRGDVFSREYGDYFSYFGDYQLDTNATSLIENYYSASPYPSTVGYEERNDTIYPKFAGGLDFAENDVVKANTTAAQKIAEWMLPFIDDMESSILFRWAKLTLDNMSDLKVNIDLTPLTITNEFDDSAMVKKLSLFELLRVIFLGERITAFDRGSITITAGFIFTSCFWKIHKITARAREMAFKKFFIKK